jgi:hypothetical protein
MHSKSFSCESLICMNLHELLTFIGQLNAPKVLVMGAQLICMNLHELLTFIGQFNAFKEHNLLRCFNLR